MPETRPMYPNLNETQTMCNLLKNESGYHDLTVSVAITLLSTGITFGNSRRANHLVFSRAVRVTPA